MLELFLFLILFLILLLIVYFGLKSYKNLFESFNNQSEEIECNNFFSKDSYCELDIDKQICSCKMQKDDLKYLFNSPENCCNRNCMKLTPEECNERNEFTDIPYFCNIGGKCVENNGTILQSRIATNNCGLDPLNNQLLLPYASKDECQKNINPCDKYNIPERSSHINEAECIKDVNCGYCTNSTGGGKCILGTAEGPSDFHKYYFCNPDIKYNLDQNNRYIYGNHAAYILQPPPKKNNINYI